jgi:hypothetical protein
VNITPGKILTEDEVFELVNETTSTLSGESRDAFKSLAKSHESLRAQVERLNRHIDNAHEALTTAKRGRS